LRPTEHKDDQASVELSQDISKDSVNKEDQSAYWYHRYSLRPLLDAQGHVSLTPTGAAVHDVPLMLAEAQDSILMTGKYLNAIRECGRQVVRPLPFDVHIEYCSSGSGSYMQNIQAAFASSSQALLHLLQHDLGLNNTLAALKHYFLLDKGDMLLSFLDTAEEELSKPASEVSVIRLQSLLDLAVRSSSAASDPTTEKLECFLDHRTLLGMLQQRAPLQEDSTALQDPRHPLTGYTLLDQHDAAMCLQGRCQVAIQRSSGRVLAGRLSCLATRWGSETLKRCYSLCQHMMHFFHQYLLYVTFEVLEPLWHTMSSQCRTANTLDEVIGHHTDFLRKVLKGCLLSRKLTLLQSLVQLKKQAAVFTQLAAALQIEPETTSDLDIVPAGDALLSGDKAQRRRKDREETAASTAALLQHVIGDPKFGKAVQELESSFVAKFSDFITGKHCLLQPVHQCNANCVLHKLQEMHRTAQSDAKESREELESLSNLIGRLDFNDFFKPKPDYRAMLAQGAI
ncbi:MAG: Spc97 Spc98 family of spindle pole body (SBP) component, partial [Trebouxia sp. A1-2]